MLITNSVDPDVNLEVDAVCKCLHVGAGDTCYSCPTGKSNQHNAIFDSKYMFIGQDFESAYSETCVDVTCDETCNSLCTDNPSEHSFCRCENNQCFTCPPGFLKYE